MFDIKDNNDPCAFNRTLDKITTQVRETQDEFIFTTLSNFAATQFNIVVEKQELIAAIQLIRMYKEYGQNIGEKWMTANKQSEMLHNSYTRGFEDGIKKEHNRIMDILEDAYPIKED